MAYIDIQDFDINQVHVFAKTTGTKERICIGHGPTMKSIAFVTPPAVTNFPRLTADGDWGTTYGPTDTDKIRFSVDINEWDPEHSMAKEYGEAVSAYISIMEAIDALLLNFMFGNQLKWLNRKNLSKAEVQMLQVPSVKVPLDKEFGTERQKRVELKTRKYFFHNGAKKTRIINICDHQGKVVPSGEAEVQSGDVVCATMHLGTVYNGVAGDKFGCCWEVEDVQVVCQQKHIAPKESIPAFSSNLGDHFTTHEYTKVEC
jgi:hypothetical protein